MNARQSALLNEMDHITEAPAKRGKRTKDKVVQHKDRFDNLSLADIKLLTEGQKQMVRSFTEGYNVVAVGSAGTGKSYIAAYLALKKLFSGECSKIIFIRSAVSVRSQGHLPGSLDEKNLVFTLPYKAIVNSLCQNGTAWDILTKKGFIEFATTTYIRGLTFAHCVVIVDEAQNLDPSEAESTITRLGDDSQLILSGDTRQNDLQRQRQQSCYDFIIALSAKLPQWMDVVHFSSADIVRSKFVKDVIIAIENM